MADEDDAMIDETIELIAADKVDGTIVQDEAGEALATVRRFMVDMLTGQVEYVLISFDGRFGLGTDHFPLPWDLLRFDSKTSLYIIDIEKDIFEDAPRFPAGGDPVLDRVMAEEIHDYYGIAYPYA